MKMLEIVQGSESDSIRILECLRKNDPDLAVSFAGIWGMTQSIAELLDQKNKEIWENIK